MRKPWFPLLMALTVTVSLLAFPGVTVSAESAEPASLTVSLVEHDGQTTSRIDNASVWAVIRLNGVTADVEAANLLLDVGCSAIAVADDVDALSPCDGVTVDVKQTGTVISIVVIGSASVAELTANGNELCRIPLERSGSADQNVCMRFLERQNAVYTGVALAEGTYAPRLGSLDYTVGMGSNPSVEGGTLINGFSAYSGTDLSAYDWSFYKTSLTMSTALPNGNSTAAPTSRSSTQTYAYGEPYYNSSTKSWDLGIGTTEHPAYVTMTTKSTYNGSKGFTFSFRAVSHSLPHNYRMETQDNLYVAIGDYTFVLKGRATPQICCGGKRVAGNEAKWTVADLSNFSSYNSGSNAYSESAAQTYNALAGGTKDDIESNIKTAWTTTTGDASYASTPVGSVTPEKSTLNNVLYTITYQNGTLTFRKDAGSSAVNAAGDGTVNLVISVDNVPEKAFENMTVTLGTECPGSTGTGYRFSEPKLTTTGATYTVSAYDGESGSWSNGKTIPVSHAYTCLAKDGNHCVYGCDVCEKRCYEQGTTFLSKIPLSDCAVTLNQTRFLVTGQAIQPTVSVCFGGTLALTDFTVDYTDNLTVGTATATVTPTVGGFLSGTAAPTFTLLKLGDLNGDGWINMTDYALLKRHIGTLTEDQRLTADLDGDSDVDNNDVTALWNKLLKKGAN